MMFLDPRFYIALVVAGAIGFAGGWFKGGENARTALKVAIAQAESERVRISAEWAQGVKAVGDHAKIQQATNAKRLSEMRQRIRDNPGAHNPVPVSSESVRLWRDVATEANSAAAAEGNSGSAAAVPDAAAAQEQQSGERVKAILIFEQADIDGYLVESANAYKSCYTKWAACKEAYAKIEKQ